MTDGELKALVIDDSPTDARILANLLTKRLQIQVETAMDGLDGLAKLSAGHFDWVFLDLHMPRMTGVEVLTKLRQSPSTASLPVIIISGNRDAQTVQSLIEFKIFDYIIKPYNTKSIAERLSKKLAALRADGVSQQAT